MAAELELIDFNIVDFFASMRQLFVLKASLDYFCFFSLCMGDSLPITRLHNSQ